MLIGHKSLACHPFSRWIMVTLWNNSLILWMLVLGNLVVTPGLPEWISRGVCVCSEERRRYLRYLLRTNGVIYQSMVSLYTIVVTKECHYQLCRRSLSTSTRVIADIFMLSQAARLTDTIHDWGTDVFYNGSLQHFRYFEQNLTKKRIMVFCQFPLNMLHESLFLS